MGQNCRDIIISLYDNFVSSSLGTMAFYFYIGQGSGHGSQLLQILQEFTGHRACVSSSSCSIINCYIFIYIYIMYIFNYYFI